MPLSKRVKLLHVEHLTVQTPSEATLIKDLSFEIFEKDHLLVSSDMSTVSFYMPFVDFLGQGKIDLLMVSYTLRGGEA